jgi:curved DNA-binding protein
LDGVEMADGTSFIDYYDILHVKRNCDSKALESAYRYLLKKYHPDHTGIADSRQFKEVMEAYRVLRDPDRRSEYDKLYDQNNREEWLRSASNGGVEIDEAAALDDADAHAKILMFLYRKRRENAQDAGVVGYYLQNMLNCSDEHFEFHKWYLKEKGFIVITEHGTLAITIQGIDHVISMSRTTRVEKLLIAQSANPQA